MKRLILTAFWASLLLVGCSKSPAPKGPETFDRYIFFSQQVESKASLIGSVGDMKGKSFGVVGFKFDEDISWGKYIGETPTAEPNVFYDENGDPVNVETISCDEYGYGTYAPLQGWHGAYKYTFFACYPVPGSIGSVTMVNNSTDGGSYTGGTPAIQYSNPNHDKSLMVDVMTAPAFKNVYWKSSSAYSEGNSTGDITFAFQHCLSSLGIKVKKSIDNEIVLNSLTLDISGIQNKSIRMTMDTPSSGTSTAAETNTANYTLTVAEAEKTITKDGVELADKLIFIPQTADLTIFLTVNYTRKKVGNYEDYTGSYTYENIQTALSQGKKHLIHLNFTETTVEVSTSVNNWTTYTVDNTFN